MHKAAAAIFSSFALTACSYEAPTDISPSYDVYSNYDNKLNLNAALYVDADEMEKNVKPSGIACSAHTYPVNAEKAFETSVFKTFENLVRRVELVEKPLDRQQMRARGYNAMLIVEAEDLDVDFKVVPGFWTSEVEADAEITARLTADTRAGRALGTTVEGDEEATSESGAACEGGATAVGEAVEAAIEETMARLGERLSNSTRLR